MTVRLVDAALHAWYKSVRLFDVPFALTGWSQPRHRGPSLCLCLCFFPPFSCYYLFSLFGAGESPRRPRPGRPIELWHNRCNTSMLLSWEPLIRPSCSFHQSTPLPPSTSSWEFLVGWRGDTQGPPVLHVNYVPSACSGSCLSGLCVPENYQSLASSLPQPPHPPPHHSCL